MTQSRFYSATAQPTVLTSPMTASQVTAQVQQTVGFPVSVPYILAIGYGTSSEEVVLVTNQAGLTLTITRGYDGTAATIHNTNDAVRHTWTAMDGNDSRAHEGSTASVHGVTSSLVGISDTQTLTNKTISTGSSVSIGAGNIATTSGNVTTTSGNITSSTGNISTTSGVGAVLFARKTADQTVTSTTSVMDADLIVPVVAGATYTIEGRISYATTAAADFVAQRLIPTGSVFCEFSTSGLSGAFTTDSGQVRMVSLNSNSVGPVGFSFDAGGTSTSTIILGGFLTTGANAGNFQFNWGQLVSTAANTTVFQNSYIVLRRVA